MKHVISSIEVQKNNKERVNIFVNDQYFLACDMSLVYTKRLEKGKEIDKNILQDIILEDNFIKAKSRGLRYLSKSYKTEKEVRDKLFQNGYDDYTINRVLEFLIEYDFVNDERYVELYIKEKCKKYGNNRIKFELQGKGIDKQLLLSKLNEIDKEEEISRAYEIALKKYNQLKNSSNEKNKIRRKLNDFLARKGYNYDIIQNIIRRIEVGE